MLATEFRQRHERVRPDDPPLRMISVVACE